MREICGLYKCMKKSNWIKSTEIWYEEMEGWNEEKKTLIWYECKGKPGRETV